MRHHYVNGKQCWQDEQAMCNTLVDFSQIKVIKTGFGSSGEVKMM